jgi:hypothetical protein
MARSNKNLNRFVSPFRREYRKGGYHCDLCDCFVGWSEKSAAVHEAGKKLKHRSRAIQNIEYFDCSSGYCSLCRKRLVSPWTFEKTAKKHANGRKHRAKWDELERKLLVEYHLLQMNATVEATSSFAEGSGMQFPEDALAAILLFAGLPPTMPSSQTF